MVALRLGEPRAGGSSNSLEPRRGEPSPPGLFAFQGARWASSPGPRTRRTRTSTACGCGSKPRSLGVPGLDRLQRRELREHPARALRVRRRRPDVLPGQPGAREPPLDRHAAQEPDRADQAARVSPGRRARGDRRRGVHACGTAACGCRPSEGPARPHGLGHRTGRLPAARGRRHSHGRISADRHRNARALGAARRAVRLDRAAEPGGCASSDAVPRRLSRRRPPGTATTSRSRTSWARAPRTGTSSCWSTRTTGLRCGSATVSTVPFPLERSPSTTRPEAGRSATSTQAR